MSPTRVILDCDTGTDDAVAIFLAAQHPAVDLVAVTAVNGNVGVDSVTDNSLRVLGVVESPAPVFIGATSPWRRSDFPIPMEVLNAADPDFQPEQLPFPKATRSPEHLGAVEFLIETYRDPSNRDITLVATGPLTNVAEALEREPEFAQWIPQLVIMGGALGMGNVTAAAEFNLWCDPEAADFVLNSGVNDIVLVTTAATLRCQVRSSDCDLLSTLGTPAASGCEALIRHRIKVDGEGIKGDNPGAPVHDALCIAFVIDETVVDLRGPHNARVECVGDLTIGHLVVDARPWAPHPQTSIRYAVDANSERFVEILCEGVGGRSTA
ncbi:MAG TPA: nucleoside hydrolase [Phycicoccus sp.]|nr:nucleoside hydrolase [Phycicoccus sp.]